MSVFQQPAWQLSSRDTDMCWQLYGASSFFKSFLSLLWQSQILTHVKRMANITAQQPPRSSGAQPLCRSLVGFLALISVYHHGLPHSEPALKTSLLIATPFSLSLEELCLELSRAIEAGDVQAASQHASALARQNVSLTIQLSEKNYPDGEIKWDMKHFFKFPYYTYFWVFVFWL